MSLFCDQTRIKLIGGKGGNGAIAFRKEKFIDRGGPNGGDAGRGGDVYLKVNHALNSLIHLHTLKRFKAEDGEGGMTQNKHGKDAEDLYLEVPQGTIVRAIEKPQHVIADLSEKNAVLLIARGGKGGFGNAHFKTSVRQAPKFAELGEDGQEIEIELELKLVADIGIIGIPSCGKSSLISVISNARPKIAAYPFTTLVPHLGVVQIDEKVTYIVADIPGLIEGAHHGKGLGIEFLKHVQRCRLLVHIVDASDMRTVRSDPIKNFELINHELTAFSKELGKKTQIVVINKADLLSDEQVKTWMKALKKEIGKKKRFILYPHAISCATRKGISELKTYLFQVLQDMHAPNEPKEPNAPNEPVIYRPHLTDPKFYTVKKTDKHVFRVSGQRIEQIANMTPISNPEARNRLYHVLKKMKILKELRRAGAKEGDKIEIGKKSIEFFTADARDAYRSVESRHRRDS